MSGPDQIWVFGAFPLGHHLYDVSGSPPLCMEEGGEVPYRLFRGCDGVDCPQHQPEGERTTRGRMVGGITVDFDGWSLVTWWDRQGDQRLGSHTGILAKGDWSDAQLVAAGRRLAPWAFRVKLGTWADGGAA